jgi:hypothetical protein
MIYAEHPQCRPVVSLGNSLQTWSTIQPAMATERRAQRGFELHVETVSQIGESDGHRPPAGARVRPEPRGAS